MQTFTTNKSIQTNCIANSKAEKKIVIGEYISKVTVGFFAVCMLFFTHNIKAQSAGIYGFNKTSGTYTPITGSTVLLGNSASANDDGVSTAVALPFTFNFAGVNYTSFAACVNGWIRLGTDLNVSSSNPTSLSSTYSNAISSTSNTQLLCAMWDDLYLLGNSSDKVHYVVTGSSPSRVVTIEWFNVKEMDLEGHLKIFK